MAKVKKEIRVQRWSGMGLWTLKNETRLWLYWMMAAVYVAIRASLAIVEEFPEEWKRPTGVMCYYVAFHIVELD